MTNVALEDLADKSATELAAGLAHAGGSATPQGLIYQIEITRRKIVAAEKEADAAERAAAATERYAKYTFWVVISAGFAAIFTAIAAGGTWYAALHPR